VLRTKVQDIRQSGRATRGVTLMNLGEGDTVVTVARISAADLSLAGADGEAEVVAGGQVESQGLPPINGKDNLISNDGAGGAHPESSEDEADSDPLD
jgi:DNA gyrase subunit A